MREPIRDLQRLEHILESSNTLIKFNEDEDLDALNEKDIKYFGIVKLLEIIGEASYKLTDEFKESHLDTPWKLMTRMRHILVHGYYQINKKDVIKTIREDIPILQNQVNNYIKEIENS